MPEAIVLQALRRAYTFGEPFGRLLHVALYKLFKFLMPANKNNRL